MGEYFMLVSLCLFMVGIKPLYGTDNEVYTNKFAVEFHGDIEKLERFARDHHFSLHGQIGSLENHYLLEHPHVYRRSLRHSEQHHAKLEAHPQIHWFEQQKIVSRKKRDFIEMAPDMIAEDTSEWQDNPRLKRADQHKRSEAKQETKREMPDLKFNDPLYPKMWYYNGGGLNHTDMNVMGAWKRGITGKNVVITILDDGIERTHDDLKDNYDPYASYDVNAKDSDPMPRYDYTNENRHGTRCAGEVSAKANNSFCVVGVAYDSKIGGVRMLDGDVFDAVEAMSLSHNRSHIDIYSASWGPDDDGRVVDGPGIMAKKAFSEGVKLGRNGKGSIFVWASGNGGNTRDSCNCDGYTNSIYTLSISSISQRGQKPWYLEECSSTLATTYSSGTYNEKQIITVDLHNKCTETHTGTSASAPLAAGIVALILEMNPSLTWRDVQYITLMTARPLPDGLWVTNGVGRQVSLRYGYGLMDATAMVYLAEKWTNVPEQHICTVHSDVANKAGNIWVSVPDSGYEETLVTDGCAGSGHSVNYLEHVQLKVSIKSKRRGDLTIHLTSPAGTKSTLLPARPNDSDMIKGFNDWAFLSVHFWGENPVGQWKLEIEVKQNSRNFYGSQRINNLTDWSLILYGTEGNPVNLVQPTPPTMQTGGATGGICHNQCLGGCSGPGADKCNGCKNYKMQNTNECVPTCPNNFYAENFICTKCVEECETCTSITAGQVMCLKCKPGYLLVEGKGTCRTICEKGYYEDAYSHHCRVCSGNCEECQGQANLCTACRWGMELQNSNCVPEQVPCPTGKYRAAGIHGECVDCPEGCFTCTSAENCTCCDTGGYLQNGVCVNSCDTGYLPFHINYSSEFVFQQCQHCDNECNICPDGFKKVKEVCIQQSNCPEGMYFQWNSMSCKQCNSSCKSCIGPGTRDCLSCYAPFGYHSLLRQCMPCCSQRNQQLGTKKCCPCVEEGKCDLKIAPEVGAPHYSINTILLVFIFIILIILVPIVLFTIGFCVVYHQKKKPHTDIRYKKLLDSERDILEDAMT